MHHTKLLKAIEQFRGVFDFVNAQVRNYKRNPVENPHNLTFEERKELELLHYHLTELLYRLRYGELDEQKALGEINFTEFAKISDKISESAHPYTII